MFQSWKSQVFSFVMQSVLQTSKKLSRSTSFSSMSKSSSNPKMKSFQGTPPVSTLNFNAKLFYCCTYECNGPFTHDFIRVNFFSPCKCEKWVHNPLLNISVLVKVEQIASVNVYPLGAVLPII